jgi:hypothetical protein
MVATPRPLYGNVPGISHEVEAVIFSALAKDPQQRFATVKDFARTFEQACRQMPVSAPSLPIAILPSSSSPSPFSTALMAVTPLPERRQDVPGQLQHSASPNTHPVISPSQIIFPTSVDTPHQAMQTNTPPSIADELMRQPANRTLPAIACSTRHSHPKSAKPWWVILTLALLIVIASSIITYAFPTSPYSKQPSSVDHRSSSVSGGHISASIPVQPGFATLQITPSSKEVKHVFTVSAVMGTPNSSQYQVQARYVTASQSQSQTTTTTGSKQTAAIQAAGTLTVTCRSSSYPLTINAGTVFTDNNDVSVTTDMTVTTSGCYTIIPAHAANAGQSGNIAAYDIHQPYHGYTISNETAFIGGQDAKTTAVVAQSDIGTTATSLETTLTSEVKQALLGKLKTNERSFGNPQCSPTVTSNHTVGDEATKVTISVLMTCTLEAYDNDGAQAMAKTLLSSQAATDLGTDYGLKGNITTTIGQPTLADPAHAIISLPVTAEGVWVYQWSDAHKQHLAKLVAGKSAQDAKMLLLRQKGVSAANILLPSDSDGVLPPNSSNITVDVATMGRL